MKEYRIVVWDDEDGRDYANFIPATATTLEGELAAEKALGWDNVVVESREVSEWEEV